MKKFIIPLLILIFLVSTAFTLDVSPIDRINEVRVSYGLGTLTHNPAIDYFAEYRITHMTEINHNNVRHDYYILKSQGVFTGKYWIGEVIAYGNQIYSTNDYVNAWLASPSHKKCILKPYFTDIGYGTGIVNNYYVIVVIFMYKLN